MTRYPILLRHQGKEIEICDLPDNKGIRIQTRSTPVATKDDLEYILEQIVRKKQELADEQDPQVKQEIEQELAALEKQKNENFDKFGNPRELSGDLKNVIETTRTRVNRWYKGYEARLPDLIKHFDKHLTISSECSYTPDDAISWDLGEK